MEIDIKHACCFTGHRPERLEIPPGKVKRWLEEQIRKAVEDGYTDFVAGMQRGVDIWAAFFQRNHWLVDHSSKVIGVFTGAPGGTKETIEYAKMNGREVVAINRYR